SPKDSNIVYAGSYGGLLTRYDHRTGQLKNITIWPDNPMGHGAEGMKYRFQWNYPILFSPHDPNVLYAAGDHLFRSTNEGQSWEMISPDLTRNDKSKQGPSGGPITKDNTSVEYYNTIFTVAESPVTRGVIWAGSDDGLVHVTRDAGKDWSNVTPKGIPEWIQINSLDASPHDAATAYVAATMYKWDDFRPYLYKTSDFGKTWRRINAGIPDGAFTRVIREDPNRRGLLYAGTETGMYVSFDDGENWRPLQLNLPIVPITDLAVHKRDRDLVVATQGRSFWILDDLTVLHQMNAELLAAATPGGGAAATRLLKPEDAYRTEGGGGQTLPPTVAAGANPPNGVVLHYYLKSRPTTDMTLEFLDAQGRSVRKFTARAPARPTPTPTPTPASDATSPTAAMPQTPGVAQVTTPIEQPAAPSEEAAEFVPGRPGEGPRVTTEPGLNRFVWDMRHAEAASFPGMILWAANMRGPRVVPGTYQVRLTVDGQTFTESFEVRKDPRLATTQADFEKQSEFLLAVRDKLTETHNAITTLRDVRKQIEDLTKRVEGQTEARPVVERGRELMRKLTEVEETLYQTKVQSSQDTLNFPIRLNNKLASLASGVASSDSPPTEQALALREELTTNIDAQLRILRQLLETDLRSFNALVRSSDVPAVVIKPTPPAPATPNR
ncbi:MAG TPA: hypothetical protein VFX96_17615, partial [Pyrinomonadaceae bacterium]|nr:hypothetical protein [Pyrinomonadaceae bacterium]